MAQLPPTALNDGGVCKQLSTENPAKSRQFLVFASQSAPVDAHAVIIIDSAVALSHARSNAFRIAPLFPAR
jgi:hypothetical protein